MESSLGWLVYVACHGAMFKGVNRSIGGAAKRIAAAAFRPAAGERRRP
jgi:hypothetical protein